MAKRPVAVRQRDRRSRNLPRCVPCATPPTSPRRHEAIARMPRSRRAVNAREPRPRRRLHARARAGLVGLTPCSTSRRRRRSGACCSRSCGRPRDESYTEWTQRATEWGHREPRTSGVGGAQAAVLQRRRRRARLHVHRHVGDERIPAPAPRQAAGLRVDFDQRGRRSRGDAVLAWSAYLSEIPHDVLQVYVDGRMTSFDVIQVLEANDARGFVVRDHHHDYVISERLAFPLSPAACGPTCGRAVVLSSAPSF